MTSIKKSSKNLHNKLSYTYNVDDSPNEKRLSMSQIKVLKESCPVLLLICQV
jgi:hypothetical protein